MSANRTNVIKKPQFKTEPTAASGVVKRAVIDAKQEARRIIDEAETEAANMRTSAEQFARELREASYQQGYEESLLEFNQLLLNAREQRDKALAETERDVLQLAVKIAEKIINREIERDSTTLADIVRTALRHARQHETLTVRVNPADLPLVQQHQDRLDPAGRARFLDIISDPRVGHGGCIIESEAGTIDAQLDTQLRVLERALLARASGETT